MTESYAEVAPGVTLCHETFGDPSDPTILLVMGLGTQMIAWREGFCTRLVDAGFHVVRFDNRDCGRSSRMEGKPPTLRQIAVRSKAARSYTLSDMAGDACGLLDHLGIGSAHVVGASMGGMIVQRMAIERPDRVRSITSIMSNTGSRFGGQPKLAVYPIFLKAAPREKQAYADHIVKLYGAIGAQGIPQDVAAIRAGAEVAYDRGITVSGTGRQLAAILADGDRSAGLGRIEVPALVVHGTTDSLVNVSGGRATAKAIPGAELLLVEGMGHDLPEPAWGQITDGIIRTARAGEAARTSRAVVS